MCIYIYIYIYIYIHIYIYTYIYKPKPIKPSTVNYCYYCDDNISKNRCLVDSKNPYKWLMKIGCKTTAKCYVSTLAFSLFKYMYINNTVCMM